MVQTDDGAEIGEPWIQSFHDLMRWRVRENPSRLVGL